MIYQWQKAALSLAVVSVQSMPATAQDIEDAYQVTRDCVIDALNIVTPEEGREFFPPLDSLEAQTSNSFRASGADGNSRIGFEVSLSKIHGEATYIDEIYHQITVLTENNATGEPYKHTKFGEIDFTNNEELAEEMDHGVQKGLQQIDDLLRACLAYS